MVQLKSLGIALFVVVTSLLAVSIQTVGAAPGALSPMTVQPAPDRIVPTPAQQHYRDPPHIAECKGRCNIRYMDCMRHVGTQWGRDQCRQQLLGCTRNCR